jgi:hypothetical protein
VSNLDLESTTLKNKNKKRKNNIIHAQKTRLKQNTKIGGKLGSFCFKPIHPLESMYSIIGKISLNFNLLKHCVLPIFAKRSRKYGKRSHNIKGLESREVIYIYCQIFMLFTTKVNFENEDIIQHLNVKPEKVMIVCKFF